MRNYKPHVTLFRPFYFGDWLHNTNRPGCTLQDEAVLLRAHNAYWQDQCAGLPADPKQLAKRLKVSVRQVQSMLDHADGMQVVDGKICFQSIDHNYEKALKLSERQSGNRKGGKTADSDSDAGDGGDHGDPEAEYWGHHGDPESPNDGATTDAPRGDQLKQKLKSSTLEALASGESASLRVAAGGDR